MKIREMTEAREKTYLSEAATLSSKTRGREKKEELCDVRTEFQRDRDRIIHSKAFRRLKHKTQVFLSPEGDHYRTRLTHTLEVAQIARTIARGLNLNEDLTEAIALGHDLGHTPFGHKGESVLDSICPYGFKHNEQSLRVVDVLEKSGGLNLTYEVRDGILCHTGEKKADTPEGRIVSFADKVAYINHDIDDAIRAGVLTEEDLPKEQVDVLGETHSTRINTLILAMISASEGSEIKMETEVYNAMMALRKFMFERVYFNSKPKEEEKKAEGIIEHLYERFTEKPELIPLSSRECSDSDDVHIIVRDYIAGMSDRYAVATYKDIFIPKFWV